MSTYHNRCAAGTALTLTVSLTLTRRTYFYQLLGGPKTQPTTRFFIDSDAAVLNNSGRVYHDIGGRTSNNDEESLGGGGGKRDELYAPSFSRSRSAFTAEMFHESCTYDVRVVGVCFCLMAFSLLIFFFFFFLLRVSYHHTFFFSLATYIYIPLAVSINLRTVLY